MTALNTAKYTHTHAYNCNEMKVLRATHAIMAAFRTHFASPSPSLVRSPARCRLRQDARKADGGRQIC